MNHKVDESDSMPVLPDDAHLKEVIALMSTYSHKRLVFNSIANKALFTISPVLSELAHAQGTTLETLLDYPLQTIFTVLLDGAELPAQIAHAVLASDKNYMLAEKDTEMLIAEHVTQDYSHTTTVRRKPTQPGKVTAPVRVILGSEQFHKMQDGDVIVCSMTDPNYVPLMKRASAIVTDMGGILCHAAIGSRELKVPCVIGTTVGTKVFTDGDLVEVDAQKGVVKILTKHA